jgi:hypothetical protein
MIFIYHPNIINFNHGDESTQITHFGRIRRSLTRSQRFQKTE